MPPECPGKCKKGDISLPASGTQKLGRQPKGSWVVTGPGCCHRDAARRPLKPPGLRGQGSSGKPCASHSWEQASDALQSRVPNCGTQFCFHRNQFGGIFIFNYSATSNFPFTPRPDRRREIAYVNHPGEPLTSLKSPRMEGA